MSEQIAIDIPQGFSSEGGGTEYRPGADIERPAAQRESVQAPQLSATQAQSQAIVGELRAKAASGTLSAQERNRLQTHWRHANGVDAAVPLELRAAPAPDHREHSEARVALEREAQPIDRTGAEQIAARMKVQGATEWAGAAENVVQWLELPPDAAKTVADRWAHHALHGQMPEGNFQVLEASEAHELMTEASRVLGGWDRFQEVSNGAMAYIARFPDLHAKLSKYGAFESSIALDPRLLVTLYHAEQRAKAKAER